jgi:iron complex outermembrane recepter protein
MMTRDSIRHAVRCALLASAAATVATTASAQDASIQEVVVTGTRITAPGAISSSPIYSLGAEEIQLQQQPEVEKILRVLPITTPSDGQNTNNGTAGVATVNLRGLGSQRNVILVNGKRLTPYNFFGIVDTSIIPTALIERVDIVTGGASAVYGSDAISGALNFILKRDFEGVEIDSNFSQFEEGDGDLRTASLTLGSNVAEGRGNIVLGINWTNREGVQLGARPLGQVGIATADGFGYEEFLAGQGPLAPPAGCGGPNAVAAGGSESTTTVPTRVSIAGGPALGQFHEDGTLGADCSQFNFNPYNYYQTPAERFGGTVIGNFEVNDHAEAYARFAYTSTQVSQQIAPSGIFGSAFFTPLANPFIGDQARNTIIAAAEAGRTAGTVATGGAFPNWRDVNGNGVVDAPDDLLIQYRRRTGELGPRSTGFDNKAFQLLLGSTGQIVGDWDYDVSLQYGESDRTDRFAGYTNVANIANAVNSVDGVTCRTGGSDCVPINLFGGFGSITPEAAAFASATALEQQSYEQTIVSASVTGPVSAIQLPWASNPLALSFGAEYREESAVTIPDECLKLAPVSCLGGNGGNTLPIEGGFDVTEFFTEALLPIARDLPGAQSLDLELGYRHSDYNLTGTDETYKYGFTWKPVDQLLFRVMKQRAARAPNVGELAAPRVASLSNASQDPCSVANANNISAELRALCISTGMSAAQVGAVEDIVSNQVNTFSGTDVNDLPAPEQADTTTFGVVWTPSFGGVIRDPVLSLDYYDIDIKDVIGTFGAQEVLDGCYVRADATQCAKIARVGGTLTLPGSGIETFTSNLDYLRAEGLEFGFSAGVDIGRFGSLSFTGNVNKYLTHESQSSSTTPILECVGRYGNNCGSVLGIGPLPEIRWIQRTTWSYENLSVSALWRHVGSVSIEPVQYQAPNEVLPQFRQIGAYNYFDLHASYVAFDRATVSLAVVNLFDKDPPIVGGEAASTNVNSGNTFPSHYDTLGRLFTVGLKVSF